MVIGYPSQLVRAGLIPATANPRVASTNNKLGYALNASARNGARLWSKTQPQRVADAQDVGTTPRAATGAPHTAALRLANLRQVHSPNIKCAHQSARSF